MRSHLKEILDSKGIKYSFIAKEASISNSTMTNLIKGGLPTLPVAARIAKVLGKPIEEIWTIEE
ncbi:helix-turn-helix transcriptional regulator [Bacillus cereus]|uniref:helix-turn-helix transcriptional regulator n=1 Tax=Bacillus cereus TaxID=1396 RepID=UPI0010BD7890|nr:helix-turn-helix transcriptional regulator [Bacillus cereus]TKH80227.1 helix-turn-helix transcriptional regulator [Bacillus cereus]